MLAQFQTNKASYVINITPEFREKFPVCEGGMEKEREREKGARGNYKK